jgi:hypothetical protein
VGLTELFVADRAQTTVTSGGTDAPVSGTVETWIVASSAMFGVPVANVSQFHVSDPFAPSEIIAVTAVSVTTWTVTRGADGTTPVPHAAGFLVFQTTTAGFLGSVAQPSSAFASVFSPLTYGATGNGIADDTTFVQECAAAAIAAGGIVDLGHYTFKTTAPIPITTGGLYMRGSAPASRGSIVNGASDIFTVTGSVNNIRFENCTFTSNTGGGHIWNASSGPVVGRVTISGCNIIQNNAAQGIWYQNNGLLINVLVDGNGLMQCSANATVSPWTIINIAGSANALKFADSTCKTGSGATAPFFLVDPGYSTHIDTGIVSMTLGSYNVTDPNAVPADAGLGIYSPGNFAGNSAVINSVTSSPVGYVVSKPALATATGQTCVVGSRGTNADMVFDNITWEVCAGGAVAITGAYDVVISECYNYDIPSAGLKANFYSFTASKSGFRCTSIKVRGGQSGGSSTTGSGFSDFYADSSSTNILIDSFGFNGAAAVVRSPAAQTTIINPTTVYPGVPVSTFPGPVAVTGTAGASASGRYVGANVSGPPATGTFLAADFSNDQAGNFWLCTVGGTGAGATWVGGTPGGTPAAPNIQFFTANGTWTRPGGAKTVFAAVMPSGGSAGAGASGPPGTSLSGGAGGAAGVIVQRQFVASDCGATEAITVGAAVTGGAPVTGMASPRGPETCGITTGSNQVTDVNAIAGDVYRSISGTGIPANAWITAVNTGTSTYTISANATATNASASLTIGAYTTGSPGVTGNASRFGNLLYCAGGSLGAGGNVVTASGGLSPFGVASAGGAGANATVFSNVTLTGGAGNSVSPGSLGPPGGPSGGGITSGGIALAGAAGIYSYLDAGGTGGTAGAVAGASPGQGLVSAVANGNIGPSAGSGAASVLGAAQGGANALANTGAGGAGGGASLNGNASGAGGNSGSGWVLVVSYFQ